MSAMPRSMSWPRPWALLKLVGLNKQWPSSLVSQQGQWWLTMRRSGEALANKPGRGRKPKLERVSKIVIGKSLQKKGFSTRKLARKLTACGHPVSKSTVRKYLHNNIHAVPYVERTLLEKMSEAIFQQDGAPAHTSKRAQEWCSNNLPSFWRKVTWPGNSPDLSPIENLRAILQKEPAWMAERNNFRSLGKR